MIKDNHIFANIQKFQKFQKFHFIDKSCILKAFGCDSVTERITLYTREFAVTESKFRFLEIKLEDQEGESFKKFRILKNDGFS